MGKVKAWLKIARLQFYPMTWVAYSLGAAAAAPLQDAFRPLPYALGYACLFLLELGSVLTNEYFDFETDRANTNASPFNGGSRVLVDGRLSQREVRIGIAVALGLLVALTAALVASMPASHTPGVLVFLAVGVLLGLGYTAPPLVLSYRGVGEVVVSATHSPYMIIGGFLFQAGTVLHPLPWILSAPLFFAVLAAITLSAIPDTRADAAVAKRTLSVALGPRAAALIAFLAVVAAAAIAGVLALLGVLPGLAGGILVAVAALHGIVLSIVVLRLVRSAWFDRRIDTAMQLALSYIIWFGLIPLIALA